MNRNILIIAAFLLCSANALADDFDREATVPHAADAAWTKAPSGLNVSWADADTHTDKYQCPTAKAQARLSLTAWRGERVGAKAVLWSAGELGEVSFRVQGEGCEAWVDATTTGFLRYVMADELNKDGSGGCGYRPDHTEYDSTLVDDCITHATRMQYQPCTARPLWVTIDVPRDAQPGQYSGTVEIASERGGTRKLAFTLRVVEATMPAAEQRRFHLDLWQNPYAVTRMADVPLWSDAHLRQMRPVMTRLAAAGQRGITATITHRPWNGQTYDAFGNMITEIKRVDGTWQYDFSVFDRWVEFMRSCGVGPYIYCYSVIPWQLTFHYYDQATNTMVDAKLDPTKPEFDDYWVPKLSALAAHLKQKGWFEHTLIAMDERPEESMKAALRVVRKADADFKLSLAGNYHDALNAELFDYCIPYDAKYPDGVIEQRRSQGRITTFYTCCTESHPNTFSFSQPYEAAALPLVSAERGLDGYLRWAYNSWVAEPTVDSRFSAWASGDTYIVYPDNQSSVRFEQLVRGIQMYEKLAAVPQTKANKAAMSRLLRPFAYANMARTDVAKSLRAVQAWLNKR